MPNNIPDTTGAVTRVPYSVRMIDHTGDKDSDALSQLDSAKVAPATLQALNVALGNASQASYYEGVVGDVFATNPDKTDATVGDRSETSNVLNILAKHPDGRSNSLVVRAPVPAIFVSGSDDIDPTSNELAAVFTAYLALLPDGFGIISARYTGRKQYNTATPI